MGDIMYHASVGPIPKKFVKKLKALDGFDQLLENIGAEIEESYEENGETSGQFFLQAEDIGQMEDVIIEFVEKVLPDGSQFFLEEGSFMIGSMGLEEEDCGISKSYYQITDGKAHFTNRTWEAQDFS